MLQRVYRIEQGSEEEMSKVMREKDVAKGLLSIKAVFFRPDEPFIWASGIKSPVYCDNRLTLTAPEVRTLIENSIADVIKEEYPEADVIMGTATAGIAHAAICSHSGTSYGICSLRRKGPRQRKPN